MEKELLREAFNEEMKGYIHAMESSDKKIAKMEEGERIMYFEETKKLLTLRPYYQEWDENLRGLLEYLSMESLSDVERDGYRLAFIYLRKYQERMEKLALRATDEVKKRALQRANKALS